MSSVNTLLRTFSQAEAGRRLAGTPLLWWVDGYVEDPFFPVSTHLSPSWPPTFINSRGVTVGWFDSKIVIFLLQKCLGQNQLVTESLPQNGTGSPGGSGCAYPCPSLTHPASLSLGCPLPKLTFRAACCCSRPEAGAALLRVHWEVWLFLPFL